MKTIAVINYKGGVGKTTFTVNIGQTLALAGYRVLVIDNDGQHNLSLLLGEQIYSPNILDVYRSSLGTAARYLLQSVRQTGIANLHLIPAQNGLNSGDVKDVFILQKAMIYCSLYKYYDFVFIDNPPGLDLLQETAIRAAHEIFIPTELSYFAINGIGELHAIVEQRFGAECPIARIIPNFYRNSKRQNTYLATLRERFPNKVTATPIKFDTIYDRCMRDSKTLFIHKLFSNAATNYIRLAQELFNIDEDYLWKQIMEKRDNKLRSDARKKKINELNSKRMAAADPYSVEVPSLYKEPDRTKETDLPQSVLMRW